MYIVAVSSGVNVCTM